MALCPFATFDEISGPVGPYTGGPSKIVHHTTEGSTYAGARGAYKRYKSDPHFTVAGEEIFQHIDTSQAARALKNAPGGAQTNLDTAIQIEAVGFAAQEKDAATLRSVAKLCRWIEAEHSVPQRWPNGRPRQAVDGKDPGGHNRSRDTWDTEGGHYGHSQVPENDHWDPGYSDAELAIITPDVVFDHHEELAATALATTAQFVTDLPAAGQPDAIVLRVLAGLASAIDSGRLVRPKLVTVLVKVGHTEVAVTLSGEERQ